MKQLIVGLMTLIGLTSSLWGSVNSYELVVQRSGISLWQGKEEVKQGIKEEVVNELLSHWSNSIQKRLPSDIAKQMTSYEIVIVLEKKTEVEGLFSPPGEHEFFNGKNQLVISLSKSVLTNKERLKLLSHELLHAIHFVMNPTEEAWVREGVAQLFEYEIHSSFNDKNVLFALTESTTPLMGEYNVYQSDPEQYGHDFLYFYYLQERCGARKSDLFWNIIRHGIESALKETKSSKEICRSFKSSAEAFMLARVMNRYSGENQSNETFILNHLKQMPRQTDFEKNFSILSAYERRSFWTELPAFLPLFVDGDWARETLKGSAFPKEMKFYSFSPVFPYTVTPINPSVITQGKLNYPNLIIFKSLK